MDSQIEEVKNKLNILDVVGSYVKLTKTGINHRGVCPFHSEKTPSFFVSSTRQMWHCFGCGAGSSIFDFVMKIEGVEFGDALRILAKKAGIQLRQENVQLRTERQRLYEICNLACLFFEKQLQSSATGKEAKAYLLKRGITSESIEKWRIGYAPDSWNGVTDFLIAKGYGRQEIINAGLAIKKEGNINDSYDRFRGRIIFPVFDLNSQVVGFGGRVFKQANENAKYINTPRTILYNKSNILYGLHAAKLAVRKQNECVITEGYTDVIMCHQVGFDNTVAASGTALTGAQLVILKRYADRLILAFDMDIAGDSATKRGINNAQEQGFAIKIIESYGEGGKKSDPADIILKDPKIWESSLSKAKSIMDYYVDSAFANFNKNTPEGKKEIGKVVLPAVKRLPNKIEQSHWVQKLANMLEVKEEAVLEELSKVTVDIYSQSQSPRNLQEKVEAKAPAPQRKKLVEEKIVSLVLKNPEHIRLLKEEYYPLFSEKMREFLREVKKFSEQSLIREDALEDDLKKTFHQFIPAMEIDSELKNFLAALLLATEENYKEDGQEEMQLCLLQLKNIELKNALNSISEAIKKAEAEKDSKKVDSLMGEFNKLAKEL